MCSCVKELLYVLSAEFSRECRHMTGEEMGRRQGGGRDAASDIAGAGPGPRRRHHGLAGGQERALDMPPELPLGPLLDEPVCVDLRHSKGKLTYYNDEGTAMLQIIKSIIMMRALRNYNYEINYNDEGTAIL